jgi:DNA-binding NarL/FixJ family response regulator
MAIETPAAVGTKIRIAIVDSQTIFRDGLVSLLSSLSQVQLVGACEDARHAITLCRETRPDVLLLSVQVAARLSPGEMGEFGQTKVVLLADSTGPMVLRELSHLAAGVIRRQDTTDRLLKTLAMALSGGSGASAAPVGALISQRSRTNGLSERESEIASLVAHGMSNREIATQLKLSEQSVKNLVSRILKKLGLNNRVQIAMKCWVN